MASKPDETTRPLRIVIIGAGIVGTSVAAQLCHRATISAPEVNALRIEIILIDQLDPRNISRSHQCHDHSRFSATFGSPGWINAAWKQPFNYHILNRLSMEMWPQFLCTFDIEAADVEYQRHGIVAFSDSVKDTQLLQKKIDIAKKFGTNYLEINHAKLQALIPSFRIQPNPDAKYYFNANDAVVNAHKVAQECMRYALESSHTRAQFIQGKVVAFRTHSDESDGANVSSIELENGSLIQCEYVILCSGISVPRMVSLIDANIHIPTTPSKGLLVEYRGKHDLDSKVCILKKFSDGNNYSLFIRNPSHVIMSGGYSYNQASMNEPNTFKKDVCSKWLMHLDKFDDEGDCAVTGPFHRPMPKDGKPVVGFLKPSSNVYVAMMHSGVTLAPLLSQLICHEVMMGVNGKQPNTEWLAEFRVDRFGKMTARL